ncbi:lipoprotein-releasing ABC transporter permease subunit [Deferribacterales bacterium RsTz2092]|nr:ABC transporter permease [Deferribacterales bacterium]
MSHSLVNIFAKRFLLARKHNRLLSFLSVTSTIGVMLGVASLIVVISVMDGFTDNLKKKFLGANPHIIIYKMDATPIDDWQQWVELVKKLPDVTSASPLILAPAMLANDRNVSGVMVRGIDASDASGLDKIIVSGTLKDLHKNTPDDKPSILLGKEVAFSMGVAIGEDITIVSPAMTRGAFGMMPKMRLFRYIGFFDTGLYEHNRTLVYANLERAQEFFATGDTINAITVYVANSDKANELAVSIQDKLNDEIIDAPVGKKFWARDWMSMNANLFASLKLEQYALFVILTLIIIVASFTIVSMITVTVKDKRKEIAIMRAMGASESFIVGIFIRQGAYIGLLGTILGNLLAIIISFILQNFRIVDLPREIYFSDTIPIRLSPAVFIAVTICAVLITFLASILPARLTARTSPIEAIRNE